MRLYLKNLFNIYCSTVLVISLVIASHSDAKQNFEGVKLSISPVADNIYIVQRPDGDGSIGVQIESGGVIFLDSLFAPQW